MSYSWQSSPAPASASGAGQAVGALHGEGGALRERVRTLATRLPRPELGALIVLTAALNLWALSRNGWANDYYSAAVRSMSSSWHNFLYASADPSGVMSVDKPPLALWVQSLSVRVFGYHPLSVLVPQALMGVASVALVYDLVRRRFGRLGGFVAGLALALTPITVAISRHNNPDALLVLCCVAALWFTVRALEDGRTRWLLLAGVCVGLGFETKMLIALAVVPGIAAAYLLIAPRGRVRALRQLLTGGAALALVGGAWPALVALTPAADRPWISGTSDNSILSLIFEYNGLGRVDGQAGGPGGLGGGNVFGGSTGPLRLLNSALGGQAGWLLGFALVSAIGLLVATRLRRADARSGWLVLVGGTFLTIAVVFSAASGIFHPYYVSLLAPFLAALVGAGAAQMLSTRATGGRSAGARLLAPLMLAAGVATELAVLHQYPGQLSWLPSVLIAVCVVAAAALIALHSPRVRLAAAGVALAALLLAPSVWALDTLGHATSGTFPEGGPGNVQTLGGGMFAGPGGFGARGGGSGRRGLGAATSAGGSVPLFGSSGSASGETGSSAVATPGSSSTKSNPVPRLGQAGAPPARTSNGAATGMPPGISGTGAPTGFGAGTGRAGGFGGGTGALGAPTGNDRTTTQALAYVKAHGGGTIAVSSQSSAATAIVASGAKIAGIGGFSGRESDVSVTWLAAEVRAGSIRWVLAEQAGTQAGPGLPGDARAGSKAAIKAVTEACRKVTLTAGSRAARSSVAGGSVASSLYDCQGRAGALADA
jgi:4-amino-4-deoxy-L-arabinose transferase-like glycosyltransferase